MVHSNITNIDYNPASVAYIANMKQAYLYLRNGARLLDILYFNIEDFLAERRTEKNEDKANG